MEVEVMARFNSRVLSLMLLGRPLRVLRCHEPCLAMRGGAIQPAAVQIPRPHHAELRLRLRLRLQTHPGINRARFH
jgi:hypothetical protein